MVCSIALFSISLLFSASSLGSELVILMSWDGMRHDYVDKAEYSALKRMEVEGIRTKLIPTNPSNTFPGHVTLATGAAPAVHGVMDNTMFDLEKGGFSYGSDANWVNAEPVWIAAERQGKKAATYFWVGSETDWRGQRHTYRMAPFDGARPDSEKVKKMIEWMDLPEETRPSLIMAYWRGADDTAHLKGPDHPDVTQIIAEQDAQLMILLKAIDSRDLWDTTTVILTSDHGMTPMTNLIAIKMPLVNASVDAQVVGGSTVKRIFLKNRSQRQSAIETLSKIPNIKIHIADEVPEYLRFPNRTGDLVITTQAPNALGEYEGFLENLRSYLAPGLGWRTGGHGYDPEHPDMASVFLAMGSDVTPGKKIDRVHQNQVAATVTELLGLEPPLHAEGQAIHLQ